MLSHSANVESVNPYKAQYESLKKKAARIYFHSEKNIPDAMNVVASQHELGKAYKRLIHTDGYDEALARTAKGQNGITYKQAFFELARQCYAQLNSTQTCVAFDTDNNGNINFDEEAKCMGVNGYFHKELLSTIEFHHQNLFRLYFSLENHLTKENERFFAHEFLYSDRETAESVGASLAKTIFAARSAYKNGYKSVVNEVTNFLIQLRKH